MDILEPLGRPFVSMRGEELKSTNNIWRRVWNLKSSTISSDLQQLYKKDVLKKLCKICKKTLCQNHFLIKLQIYSAQGY